MQLPPGVKERGLEMLAQRNRDTDYLCKHFDELAKEHPYQYVAIYNGELIVVAPTKFRLALHIRRKGFSEKDLMEHMTIEHLDPDPPELFCFWH